LIDSAMVERHLERRLGGSVRLRSLTRTPMGLSRETWLLTLDDRRLVLRRDNPGGAFPIATPLATEFEFHRRLPDTGLPVARALWFIDDPEEVGAIGYVREYIEGGGSPPGLYDPDPRNDEIRVAVAKEHARRLAQVHAVDWKALGLDELIGSAPARADDAGVAAVDRVLEGINRVAVEPLPVAWEAARRLRERAPKAPGLVLCKGSNGEMQEIWRGHRIVGLSDWELASIGDPANDWARCQNYLDPVPGRWEEHDALAYYAELGGARIDPESVQFYRLFFRFEMTLVAASCAVPVVSGTNFDARLAQISARLHRNLAELLLALEE
jgi:aminoglycoside phosphotransferase (APT) family kinase protein